MSKSLGNVIDGAELLEKYPVDLIRFYFIWKASPIEPLSFSTDELMSRPYQVLAYYCKGGFQQLANTLVKGLRRYCGEIRFRSPVEKILIENKQVSGVMVKGQRLSAPVVISNADIRHSVFKMIGEHYFPSRFIQRIKKMQHSLSIFAVYIATDIDLAALGIAHGVVLLLRF